MEEEVAEWSPSAVSAVDYEILWVAVTAEGYHYPVNIVGRRADALPHLPWLRDGLGPAAVGRQSGAEGQERC